MFSKYVTVLGTSWSHLTVLELRVSVQNFLITSVLFSKYVAVLWTSWSHLYCFRNMTVFGTSWSHLAYCFRNMWQYSELLHHTRTVFEICDSTRNFLITPSVLFSKCVTVLGISWSYLYCFLNMWVFRTSWSHLYCFRNVTVLGTSWSHLTVFEICNCPEFLDHTFCTLYEIYDSIRWHYLTTGLWRLAQTDVDVWPWRPGLNPISVRVGFVVLKVVLR
jgi:hypothetical protein